MEKFRILTDGRDLQIRCFAGCEENPAAALSAQTPNYQ